MVDERGLVALLHRADWRRLSLSGEVHGRLPPLMSLLVEEPRAGEPVPPTPPFRPPSGSSAETDMTLLVAPGRRYRVASPEGPVWGCDGERAWALLGELPPGRETRFWGDLDSPLPELLDPSWLLFGFDLTVEGDATACGRAAIRVAASARQHKPQTVARPSQLLRLMQADRVAALIDAELGILLRCESQHGEQAPNVAEFRSLTVDPDTDPALFTAPAGSILAEASGVWNSFLPFGAPGREVAKTAAGLAAAGLGAAIRYTPRRRPDPFARATEEAADPDAAIPRDDGAAPDGVPAAPGSPVSDEVLHLLYRSSQDMPRFTATLHLWINVAALLEAVPESARKTGFGGVGFLVDAVRDAALAEAALQSGTVHLVSSVRIGGWDRYRIDVAGDRPLGRDRHIRRLESLTEACDGRRRWQVYEDRVVAGPAAPLPEQVAGLVDGSWLLGGELSGGEEITVGGRRAYRLLGRSLDRLPWSMMDLLPMKSLPVVAAVDTESGRLLRLSSYAGGQPVLCRELRDISPDESGDFGFEPPAGLRVVEEETTEQQPAEHRLNPTGLVAKAATDAVRGWLRGTRR
jgi:hypothetical protein